MLIWNLPKMIVKNKMFSQRAVLFHALFKKDLFDLCFIFFVAA